MPTLAAGGEKGCPHEDLRSRGGVRSGGKLRPELEEAGRDCIFVGCFIHLLHPSVIILCDSTRKHGIESEIS